MTKFHFLSDYIIRKGAFLSCVMLAAALILFVWADASPSAFPLLRRYAEYFQTSASTVLAAALFGGLFLEDILRKRRH